MKQKIIEALVTIWFDQYKQEIEKKEKKNEKNHHII